MLCFNTAQNNIRMTLVCYLVTIYIYIIYSFDNNIMQPMSYFANEGISFFVTNDENEIKNITRNDVIFWQPGRSYC